MRNKIFYDLAQAKRYLDHSIIRIGDEPVWIEEVTGRGGKFHLHYSFLHEVGLEYHSIDSMHSSVNMNPVPLGMVNTVFLDRPQSYYCSRAPVRKQRIGLARDNLDVRNNIGQAVGDAQQRILPSPTLAYTIKGKFPTVEKAYNKIRKLGGSVAFSRRFCMDGNGNVWYMAYPAAVGTCFGGPVLLRDEYIYLNEVLQEDLNARN